MNFYSDAKQDQFVANISNFKRNGYCVDIGSCHSVNSNNTFALQELDWTSITVEINSMYNESYSSRKNNTHLNQDALSIDYKALFETQNFPKSIDYLSLDVDTLSLSVLRILPFNEYRFKVITIEHDAYLHGDMYRAEQRDILTILGYRLVCSNILVPNPGHSSYKGEPCPFEDWWVDPNEFDRNFLDQIKSDLEFPSKIISKF